MSKWNERIQKCDFDVKYKKSEEVVNAEALGRLYEEEAKFMVLNGERCKIMR